MITEEYYIELSKHIYWKKGKPYWNKDRSSVAKKDKIAGYVRDTGYRVIGTKANGLTKYIKAHRLRWYMKYKELPKLLDHKDLDPDNNALANLRIATTNQNNMNIKPYGKSKYKGVTKTKYSWAAQITVNKKHHNLGYYKKEKDAAKAYDRALIKYGLEEFGYFNFPIFECVKRNEV